MIDISQDRDRAVACLRMARNDQSEADKRTWLMLAEVWFQLAEFRLKVERELEIAKREASALKIAL
jgi:hypothetical protein